MWISCISFFGPPLCRKRTAGGRRGCAGMRWVDPSGSFGRQRGDSPASARRWAVSLPIIADASSLTCPAAPRCRSRDIKCRRRGSSRAALRCWSASGPVGRDGGRHREDQGGCGETDFAKAGRAAADQSPPDCIMRRQPFARQEGAISRPLRQRLGRWFADMNFERLMNRLTESRR
jgi:hypothetical protein